MLARVRERSENVPAETLVTSSPEWLLEILRILLISEGSKSHCENATKVEGRSIQPHLVRRDTGTKIKKYCQQHAFSSTTIPRWLARLLARRGGRHHHHAHVLEADASSAHLVSGSIFS